MKIYKGYEKYAYFAEPYIKANRIRCRYYGWVGMVGKVDFLKIDGKIRKFNIDTKEEIFER